ncbi:MAG: DUF3794 domain-containing protein [Firmicutes bacterium]|nr:DUF3794 domain-containing protein [Bacillota bacterium]
MDYEISKHKISMINLLYKGVQEVPIDTDFTLPDYCPDIGRILKCQVSASVTSRNISGDRLVVEGSANLEFLYTDLEKNTLRCYKTDIPFSQSFNLKISPQLAVAVFNIKREYINCRAVSPRRVDIHGAFSLRVQIFGRKSIDITTDIIGDDIKQKKSNVNFSQLNSLLQHQFNVGETLDLGSDKGMPEFIIKSNISVNDLTCKPSGEKINIKAKANVRILYISDIETGRLENAEYDIPINEIIDSPGVLDDDLCMIIPEVLSHEEKISSDSESSSNLISTEIKIMLTIFSFQKDEAEIVNDAYSTEFDVELSKDFFNIEKFIGSIDERFLHRASISMEENKVSKILDIWPDSIFVNQSKTNENLTFKGKINICILAVDPNFIPFYLEREIEFVKEFSNQIQNTLSNAYIFVTVPNIGYKLLDDNALDLKLDIEITANLYECSEMHSVVEAVADELNPKQKDLDAALTVYYANSGESIWEIAKRYGTTVEKIQDENDIDFEVLDTDRAILIPIN